MKTKIEQYLNLSAAMVALVTAFGLNATIAALLLAAINVGLALCAEMKS
jgi:hypothetical protein